MGLTISCVPTSLPNNFTLPTPRPVIPATPSKALSEFQAPLTDESNYHFGNGDEVTIEVWGYPELSGKHVIGPDGKITLPLVGTFRLTDLSREGAAQQIKTKLAPYYMNISVSLRVDRYASNRILVLGRVSHPGAILFGMTSPTLMEALSLAGGVTGGGDTREAIPFTRCAIFRGRDKIVWVDLEPLLTGKDLSLNLKLQRNDIVYVPELEEKLVYVLGEVRNPGAIPLTPRMSFMEALAKAGGPTIDAAPNRIHLIRPSAGLNQSLALNDLITPQAGLNVGIQEGDIVYVPMNTIAKVNYAIQILNPFSTILGVYANIQSIRSDRQNIQIDEKEKRLRDDKAALEAEKAAIEAEKKANTGLE